MITLTVGNIFQLISFTGPLILGFFMVIMSVFNQDIRGIIYLAGVLIASIINSLLIVIGMETLYPHIDPITSLTLKQKNSPII